jgi:hypothetical protein
MEFGSGRSTLETRVLDDLRDTLRDATTARGITQRISNLFPTQKGFNDWRHMTVATEWARRR